METLERPFFGRDRHLREIAGGLSAAQPISYAVVGAKLIGKTRLLQRLASAQGPLADSCAETGRVATVLIDLMIDCGGAEAQRDLLSLIADRLARRVAADKGFEFARERAGGASDPREQVLRIHRKLAEDGGRALLLLDNLDALVGDVAEATQTWAELDMLLQEMPAVVASEQPLYDLDRTAAASFHIDGMAQLFLGLMDPAAARTWTESYLEDFAGLLPASDHLAEMTGMHPFLLDRLGYTLDDVQGLLAPGQTLGPEHVPMIRMRLAEHGRPLFVTLWQGLQSPPPRVNVRALLPVVERLLREPLPLEEVEDEQSSPLNWLINQAVIVYGSRGYQFACPLFAEFLSRRISAEASGRMRRMATDGRESPFLNSLTKTENALLRYFQANSNTVISPEELLADVWNRPDASAAACAGGDSPPASTPG